MFHSKHTKQNPYLLNRQYLTHEYFADFLNFLKMSNHLLQLCDTTCMKDVLNCTSALTNYKLVQPETILSFWFVTASRKNRSTLA